MKIIKADCGMQLLTWIMHFDYTLNRVVYRIHSTLPEANIPGTLLTILLY